MGAGPEPVVTTTPFPGQQSYTDVLPSVQFQYSLGASMKIRAAYGATSMAKLCRFYLGMSKLDRQTSDALKQGVPMPRTRTVYACTRLLGTISSW